MAGLLVLVVVSWEFPVAWLLLRHTKTGVHKISLYCNVYAIYCVCLSEVKSAV